MILNLTSTSCADFTAAQRLATGGEPVYTPPAGTSRLGEYLDYQYSISTVLVDDKPELKGLNNMLAQRVHCRVATLDVLFNVDKGVHEFIEYVYG